MSPHPHPPPTTPHAPPHPPGNYDIIALRNAYHGLSGDTMGLCGQHTWKQPLPQGFGVRHALNPDPYRGPFGNDGKR
jgi:alanine-glyoxylate transaminase/(R)-3-amino-2-methylpropionate-pyruvate transaminase